MAYFVADIYSEDLGALPNFKALVDHPRVLGCILKATQGVQFAPKWFVENWPRLKDAGGLTYGNSWFRGCYHYGMPNTNGATQADFLLRHVEKAGGFDRRGDLPVAWDVENKGWEGASTQNIVDVSSQFSARIIERTGVVPYLYTGALVRDKQITNKMGFKQMWTPHLNMTKAGWQRSEYALWQYAGDGKWYDPANRAKYGFPTSIDGWGGTDMSAIMYNGEPAQWYNDAKSALGFGPSLMGLGVIAAAGLLGRAFGIF